MANWYDGIPAPVDANGREVPLDTKELVYKGEQREVLVISYNAAAGLWVADLTSTAEYPFLSACTLPDSWERLEEDVRNAHCNEGVMTTCCYFGYGSMESCAGCPARNVSGGCYLAAFDDILRRAKVLAGVTDGE